MKKGKKFIVGIVLLAIGVVGLFGLFGSTEDKTTLAGGSVLLIVVGCVLIVRDKKRKPSVNTSSPAVAETISSPAPVKNSVPDGEMNHNLFEGIVDDFALCYEYEKSLCMVDGAIDSILGNGGKSVVFRQEPENPHDGNAVAVYLNDTKIGYIYRGTVQDMFNDYTKRGWLVLGYINKYSASDNTATYKIGFYKPLDKFLSKRFSVVGIQKKIDEYTTREDNLTGCREGEEISVEYDDEGESYLLFNEYYEEIGELPKSAFSFINDNEHKKVLGILNELDEDENDKIKARVTVYLVR